MSPSVKKSALMALKQHTGRGGYLNRVPRSAIFPIFRKHQNTGYFFQITFIFERGTTGDWWFSLAKCQQLLGGIWCFVINFSLRVLPLFSKETKSLQGLWQNTAIHTTIPCSMLLGFSKSWHVLQWHTRQATGCCAWTLQTSYVWYAAILTNSWQQFSWKF